jgi:hypothetical protein
VRSAAGSEIAQGEVEPIVVGPRLEDGKLGVANPDEPQSSKVETARNRRLGSVLTLKPREILPLERGHLRLGVADWRSRSRRRPDVEDPADERIAARPSASTKSVVMSAFPQKICTRFEIPPVLPIRSSNDMIRGSG